MSKPRVEDILPLSPLQQGLLFHAEFDDSEHDVYTVQLSVDLEGVVDRDAFWAAVAALLQRHPNLRAAFRHRRTGEPVQVVPVKVSVPRSEIDLSDFTEEAREAEMVRLAARQRDTRFDLARPPAVRFTLITLAPQRHRLLFACHHILLDGWSVPLLVEELSALYRAAARGLRVPEDAGLPPVTPYRDYLGWLESRDRDAAEQEWRQALDGLDEPSHLVPGGRAHGGCEHIPRTLTTALTDRLHELARGRSLTLNTVVQLAWAIVLGQLTRRDDVVFGATTAGRPPELPGSERMIGLFINTVPVRCRLLPAEPVGRALARLQEEQSRLLEHQHLGLARIQRLAGIEDLFDTLLVFQSFPGDGRAEGDGSVGPPGLRVTGTASHDATHYPVSLVVIPGDELSFRLTHRRGAVVPGGTARLLDRLVAVLDVMAEHPQLPVGRIGVASPDERHRILAEWNDDSRERLPVPPGDAPPIGRPVPGARAYVLGPGLRLLPPEVTGELYLSGAGLARGYLNRPGMTAERFLPDPYGSAGTRMYRTGDLASWRADGQLEYRGRVDHQVKIRGFRVETVEVEKAVSGHPAVAATVVLAREDRPGDRRLVAYAVERAGHRLVDEDLLRHVAAVLPEYMVPSAVVRLDRIPTTAHGKVDRKALPAPVVATAAATRRPRSDLERTLCAAVAEILGVREVGIDDNFFALGGDSLSAARLVSRLRTARGLRLSIRDLYESLTVAGLVERSGSTAAAGTALATLLPIRADGARPPLFCVHPGSGLSWSYAGLLRHVEADRPIHGVQALGLAGATVLPDSVEAMAREYLRAVRQVQPAGPYHLLGWSFGGVVAHAMAARLQQQGERVGLLAILDSYPRLPRQDIADPDRVFAEGVGLDPEEFRGAGPTPARVLEAARRAGNPIGTLEEGSITALIAASAHHLRLMDGYGPPLFRGEVLSFEAGIGRPDGTTQTERWGPYVLGTIENHLIDCRHEEMTRPESLARIGPVLSKRLGHGADR